MGLFDKFRQKRSDEQSTVKQVQSSMTADELLEMGKAYVSSDTSKAFECFFKAANMGNAEAMARVGYSYLHMGQGVPFDINKSAYWYNKAAENGYAKSMVMASWFYMAGIGAPQDDSKAKALLNQAIQSGDEKLAAMANKYLSDFENSKITIRALFHSAVEMNGIPPKT